VEIEIYRKTTSTDTTIHFTPNHPTKHKMAAYTYCIHRMYTFPISEKQKQLEMDTSLQVAGNNGYPQHLIIRLKLGLYKHDIPNTTQ